MSISLTAEPELNPDEVQMLADEALFSEFLRSLSPSLYYIGADYAKDDLRTSISPQTIIPIRISPRLAEIASERVPDVRYKNV